MPGALDASDVELGIFGSPALVALAPLFVVALIVLITTSIKTQKQTSEAYSKAGAVASETFSAIRTVAAYGGERHELARYARHVFNAAVFGVRRGIGIGFSVGIMVASFYLEYGISLFAGARFIAASRDADASCRLNPLGAGCYNGGTVITTFTSVLIGASSISQLGVLFGAFAAAQVAAFELYAIIDRVPAIDPSSDAGEKPPRASVQGRLEFRNVT